MSPKSSQGACQRPTLGHVWQQLWACFFLGKDVALAIQFIKCTIDYIFKKLDICDCTLEIIQTQENHLSNQNIIYKVVIFLLFSYFKSKRKVV